MLKSFDSIRTGDLYLEDRVALPNILEKAHDPEALWNGIGIFVKEQDELGILLLRSDRLSFVSLESISNDKAVLAAVVKPLSKKKFKREQRFKMQAYYEKYYGGAEKLNIKMLNRVFQHMGYNKHPKVKTPDYYYTQNGDLRDAQGRPLKEPSRGMPVIEATIYSVVSSILSAARVAGLNYDPEFTLSEMNEQGRFQNYFDDEFIFKKGPVRSPNSYSRAHSEIILSLQKDAAREAGDLIKLYFESYFLTVVNPEQEDEPEIDDEVFEMRATPSEKFNPVALKRKADLYESEQNRRRVEREMKMREELERKQFSYK